MFNIKNDKNTGQYLDYPLNCKSIKFPTFKLGTSSVAYLSYGFDVSTRQNVTEKELQIDFLISNNWLQYLMLLKWFELEDFTRYNLDRKETQLVDIGNIKPVIDDSDFRTPYETRKRSILFNTTVQWFHVIYIY